MIPWEFYFVPIFHYNFRFLFIIGLLRCFYLVGSWLLLADFDGLCSVLILIDAYFIACCGCRGVICFGISAQRACTILTGGCNFTLIFCIQCAECLWFFASRCPSMSRCYHSVSSRFHSCLQFLIVHSPVSAR